MSGGTEKEMHNKKSNHHGPAHVSSTGSAFPECFLRYPRHSQVSVPYILANGNMCCRAGGISVKCESFWQGQQN